MQFERRNLRRDTLAHENARPDCMADILTVSTEPADSAPTFTFRRGAQIFGSNFACLISFNIHRILTELFPIVNV